MKCIAVLHVAAVVMKVIYKIIIIKTGVLLATRDIGNCIYDCARVCNGTSQYDCFGVCGGLSSGICGSCTDDPRDCAGNVSEYLCDNIMLVSN